jgi:neutral ceramidase
MARETTVRQRRLGDSPELTLNKQPKVDRKYQKEPEPSRYRTICVVIAFSVVAISVFANFLPTRVSRSERSDHDSAWLVHFAKRDITPSEPILLSGFSSRSRAPSAAEVAASASALFVRAMALGRTRELDASLVLVSLDLIGADGAFTDRVYDRLSKDLGLARANVRLCFSHTHSGPFVGRNLFPLAPEEYSRESAMDAYADTLEQTILEVVRESLHFGNAKPVFARFGQGSVVLAVNRRHIREADFDGSERGETDDCVPVLWFESVDSRAPVGGVFGFAAHATVITTGYEYHGDYPGVSASILEGKFGGTWLFVCGPGGDQNIYPRGQVSDALRHGSSLAAEAIRVVGLGTPPQTVAVIPQDGHTTFGLKAFHEFIKLPLRKRLSARELRRLTRLRGVGDAPTVLMAKHWSQVIALQNDNTNKRTPAEYPSYPISVWQIGSIRIVFLGGEPTVGYGAILRREAGVDWVVGYSDNVMGYVGTEDVMKEGLREGSDRAAIYYGLPCAWATSVEREIVASVKRLTSR